MEITREFVINLLKQVDFDPEFHDRLRARANIVRPILLEVARGEAKEANDYMRKNAIAMLGTAGDETSIDTLLGLLDHQLIEFRTNAIRSLGKIGSGKAAAGLGAKLGDPKLSPTEGKIIVAALAQIGRAESVAFIEKFRKRFEAEKKESPGLQRDLQEIDDAIKSLVAKSP